MGVDYFHGVYAADTSKAGSVAVAQGIEEVLRSHGLVAEPVSRWGLDAENTCRVDSDKSLSDIRNVGISFSSMSGHHAPIVECILGEAELVPDDNWAWADFYVVSGPDYRLVTEGESGGGALITEPATVDGAEAAAFFPERPGAPQPGDGWGHMAFGAQTFDAATGCSAPSCELEPQRDPYTGALVENSSGFTGLWRTALLIQTKPYDWTTDGDSRQSVLPESAFKNDLWSALGGSAYELGYVW